MRRSSGVPGDVAKRRAVRWAAGPTRSKTVPPQAVRAGVPSRPAPERQPRGRRAHDDASMITYVRSSEITIGDDAGIPGGLSVVEIRSLGCERMPPILADPRAEGEPADEP